MSVIGETPGGQEILVADMTSSQGSHDTMHVLLIAGLNGDQPLGPEILIRFVRHLLRGRLSHLDLIYSSQSMAIWSYMIPPMNGK